MWFKLIIFVVVGFESRHESQWNKKRREEKTKTRRINKVWCSRARLRHRASAGCTTNRDANNRLLGRQAKGMGGEARGGQRPDWVEPMTVPIETGQQRRRRRRRRLLQTLATLLLPMLLIVAMGNSAVVVGPEVMVCRVRQRPLQPLLPRTDDSERWTRDWAAVLGRCDAELKRPAGGCADEATGWETEASKGCLLRAN